MRALSSASARGGPRQRSLLETLAFRYEGALTRYFARRAPNSSDVPDLVQDVFLRLAKLEDVSAIEKPEQYLFATASAALKDQARRASARSVAQHQPFDETLHCPAGLDAECVLESRDASRRLETELRAMPVLMRDIFVLRVFEGRKMAEVARAVGVSLRTTEKHYARAMARLAAAVGPARP